MATPIELQWRGMSAPRAKRISPQEWEMHRAEITQLYQTMTLRCLMETMKNKYGFTPSRRQYVFQFEKWDLQKPGRNQSSAHANQPVKSQEPVQHFTPSTTNSPNTTATEATPTPRAYHSYDDDYVEKRPRSIQSSTGSIGTVGPTKKRQKGADGQDDADGSPASGPLSPPESLKRSDGTSHSSPAQQSDSSSGGYPTAKGDAESTYQQNMASSASFVSRSLPSIDENSADQITFTEFGRLSLDVPDFARQIDSNRLIETYSDEEMMNITRVAQFLDAFQLNESVFSLYTLVIKWLCSRAAKPGQDRKVFWSTLIYGRNVHLATHCEIIRNLLNQVRKEMPKLSALEMFLIDMTIAMIMVRSHGLDNDTTKENRHMNRAKERKKTTDLFAQLPPDDRSLDLMTYHMVWICDLDWNVWYAFSFPPATVEDARDQLIIERVPGPFELTNGRFANPCLRSCLDWCTQELDDISSGSKPEKSHMTYKDEKSLHVFTILWEKFAESDFKSSNPSHQTWMTETDTRMGISCVELLISVCTMIAKGVGTGLPLAGTQKKVRNMYKSSKKLQEKDDNSLARSFLREFANRRSSGVLFGNKDFQKDNIKDAAFRIVEHSLKLKVPEQPKQPKSTNSMPPPGPTSASNGPDSKRPEDSHSRNARTSYQPTMASSNSSFDLSSMRRMRDYIRRTDLAAAPAGTALPSSALRDSMTSDVSILAMGELPDFASAIGSIDTPQSNRNSTFSAQQPDPRSPQD